MKVPFGPNTMGASASSNPRGTRAETDSPAREPSPGSRPSRLARPQGPLAAAPEADAVGGQRHSAFKAVIFDLDNTLADATLVGKNAFDPAFDAIRRANDGRLSEEQLQEAFKACWHTAFYTVAARHGFSQAMTEAGAEAFRHLRVPEDAGYHGYADLAQLPLLPLNRYLVTSGFREFQNSKVDTLGIRDQFDGIEIDDPEDHPPGSNPGKTPLFEKIRDELQVDASEILVVGDNPGSEIAVGNALGMTTVQMLRPGVEATADADHQFKDLSELQKTLGIEPPPGT